MNTMSADSTFHFPVRHDRWDTVDYYLATAGLFGLAMFAMVASAIGDPRWQSALPRLGYMIVFLPMAFRTARQTIQKWEAEEYIFTDDALVFEYPFRQLRVPYDNIASVHPIKVCRLSLALKPAHRINFCRPIGFDRAGDAYPIDDAGFLEELFARCPQLERSRTQQEGHRALLSASRN
jgi:hypothetical protein